MFVFLRSFEQLLNSTTMSYVLSSNDRRHLLDELVDINVESDIQPDFEGDSFRITFVRRPSSLRQPSFCFSNCVSILPCIQELRQPNTLFEQNIFTKDFYFNDDGEIQVYSKPKDITTKAVSCYMSSASCASPCSFWLVVDLRFINCTLSLQDEI